MALPLQDYWFSLVFKRLVGPRVLAVRVAGLQRKPQPGRVIRDKLRIYAHCTSYYKYVQCTLSTWCKYVNVFEDLEGKQTAADSLRPANTWGSASGGDEQNPQPAHLASHK